MSRSSPREVANATDADEAEHDPPDGAIAIHLNATDDECNAEAEQHDRKCEASNTEGDREALGDGASHGPESAGLRKEGEGADNDEQQDPQIAGVTLPDARFR